MTALTKYLTHYAEPETLLLDHTLNHAPFQQGIVLPVYREDSATVDRFAEFAERNPGSLLIVVINRPVTDKNTDWAEALFANQYCSINRRCWQSAQQQLSLYCLDHGSALLLVDRCIHGPAIAKDQGVGLARKTGADILCQLIARGAVKSPWIANTDADAWLPAAYFSPLDALKNTAAVVYPFEHTVLEQDRVKYSNSEPAVAKDNTVLLPTLLYEFSLHYYVCGLSWAGSPYAFHTLGSTIAVHYQYYAKVRGFPKRAAAEDFYLLNKIAKTGRIKTLDEPLIQLQARTSSRVPFGTGPAVSKLADTSDPLSMPVYHPDSFVYLQFFLQLLVQLADSGQTGSNDLDAAARQLADSKHTHIDLTLLLELADTLKLTQALNHSFTHGKNTATRRQHLQHWFDGFKTLKFIHLLRDRHLGIISFRHWLEHSDHYLLPGNKTMNCLIQRIKAATWLAPQR